MKRPEAHLAIAALALLATFLALLLALDLGLGVDGALAFRLKNPGLCRSSRPHLQIKAAAIGVHAFGLDALHEGRCKFVDRHPLLLLVQVLPTSVQESYLRPNVTLETVVDP